MLVSKQWLEEFLSFPKTLSDSEIAHRLSLCTVEVEGIRQSSMQDWNGIVVGEITELKQHPNADRLRLALTRISPTKNPIVIVCGGSNLAVGMKVAVALPGSRVRWHGEGELVELAASTIRGVASDGMICTASEIGVSEQFPVANEREILDLSFLSLKTGTPLAEVFQVDTLFDVDNKSLSNRPDLWGHRGMARELGAVLRIPFSDKKLPAIKPVSRIKLNVSVEDKELCGRYMAVAIDGVSMTQSPHWMQQRLRSCGLRPINAIVDVTNYVMLEYGQPMHAFDYDRLKEKNGEVHLHVRRAKAKESLIALDGKSYVLSSDMLLIANARDPLAIAGVMGGEKSAIGDSTKTIILEAAHFNASSIRKTSTALKLVSESSRRFEKHLDPLLSESALRRAVELYWLLFPTCRVISAVSDVFTKKEKPLTISLSDAYIESKFGMHIPIALQASLLKRLGFGIAKKGSAYTVSVPSHRRKDVSIAEDICEEIVRLVGYDRVPSLLPPLVARMPPKNSLTELITEFKRRFSLQCHFNEVHNYAFVTPSTLRACGYAPEDHTMLSNPFSDERPYLCKSLIPNLLEDIEKNQEQHERITLFEISHVFLETSQPYHAAGVVVMPKEPQVFAYVKDSIVSVVRDAGYDISLHALDAQIPWSTRLRGVSLCCNNIAIGSIAVVDTAVCSELGIEREAIAWEIDVSLLHSFPRREQSVQQQDAYPAVLRDATFIVDEVVQYKDILLVIASAHPLIESSELFDIYRGAQIGKDKKSFSFHIVYRSTARTLTAEEADKAHIEIIALLEKKCGALLR